jgi:DnaJ-class molecular chaperone
MRLKQLKYFKDCETSEQARSLYQELVKKYHPDKNGDEEIFKEIGEEYSKITEYFEIKKMKKAEQKPRKKIKIAKEPANELAEAAGNFLTKLIKVALSSAEDFIELK